MENIYGLLQEFVARLRNNQAHIMQYIQTRQQERAKESGVTAILTLAVNITAFDSQRRPHYSSVDDGTDDTCVV